MTLCTFYLPKFFSPHALFIILVLVLINYLLGHSNHTKVACYAYADWAGSPSDIRSNFGYCVSIGENFSWKSKKQSVVAKSSAEAKYKAMVLATCEIIWLKQLLKELQFGEVTQMTLICDN